ncbi:MAG: sensor histidine kinase [Acidobacteria bacterium]|nr:sensor histidine kinase [Acidobacteriota bacterium]
MHDETSQILAAIMMNIDVVDRQLQSRKPYRARLKAVKALAEEAARNLNKVLLDLRPALLDELGLVEALRWYVSQMQEVWGLPVTIQAKKMPRLPEHVEMAAFRIAQEAVANAVRHGAPRSIRMKVAAPDGTVRVEVEDDGSGFDVAGAMAKARTGEAVGLLGMIERAELLGGRLEVQSQPGKGTRISAEIPIGGG